MENKVKNNDLSVQEILQKEVFSVQEILQKEVFNVKDVETLFGVKRCVAYRIMRQIKAFSDRLGLSGRIHKKDYEDYINRSIRGI